MEGVLLEKKSVGCSFQIKKEKWMGKLSRIFKYI